MILIDSRIGSRDLYPYLQDVSELTHLEFADCCFMGNGEGDNGEEEIISIGIERKNTADLINSIDSGRLAGHQLEGLLSTYQAVYLIVEGGYRPGDTGDLECYRRGKWQTETRAGGKARSYAEITSFLNTLTIICGLHIRQTGSPKETAALVRSLYQWWSKPYSAHNSHKAIHSTSVTGKRKKPQVVTPISKQQMVILKCLAQIPGIEQRARTLAPMFSCLMEAAVMSKKDWVKIPGVGPVLADRLVTVFQGEQK